MDISILLGVVLFPLWRDGMDWGLEWYERSADSVSPYRHISQRLIHKQPIDNPAPQHSGRKEKSRWREHTRTLLISPINHTVFVPSGSRTAAAPLQYTKWNDFVAGVPGAGGILANASSAASVYSWFIFR
jgi:hypothetical protein